MCLIVYSLHVLHLSLTLTSENPKKMKIVNCEILKSVDLDMHCFRMVLKYLDSTDLIRSSHLVIASPSLGFRP